MYIAYGLMARPFTGRRDMSIMERPDVKNTSSYWVQAQCPVLCPAPELYVERTLKFGTVSTKVLAAETAAGTFLKPTETVGRYEYHMFFGSRSPSYNNKRYDYEHEGGKAVLFWTN